jgi:endonuclease G, mitochondrial
VVLDTTGPEKKGIGFWIPNQGSTLPLTAFAYPIDSIEVWTGLNFFPQLSVGQARYLEGNLCLECWSWKPSRTPSSKASGAVPVLEPSEPEPVVGAEGMATQCLGITKKGNRCKRKTRSSNGFCWQHGG